LLVNLKLRLSQEKTFITNAKKNSANFLGLRISRLSTSKGQMKNIKNSLGHRVRIGGSASMIKAPINELIEKLIERQLATYKINSKNKKMIVGLPMLKLQHLPLYDIVIRYKSVLNGIFNYYSFVDNRSRLNVIY